MFQPRAHRARRIGTERYADGIEPRPIVAFEQTGREMHDGVIVEIGGQIRHADSSVCVAFAAPRRHGRCGPTVIDVNPRAGQLIGGGIANVENRQRFSAALARANSGEERIPLGFVAPPVAGIHPRVQQCAGCIGKFG